MRHLTSTARAACLLFIVTALFGSPAAQAQAKKARATPTMLKGPDDWRFERLPIPPGFARDITWTGYEEARFAPGMFDTASETYFTYALAVNVEGTPAIQAAELKEFFEKYFRGLSTMVGRRKGLTPDAAQFQAEVAPRGDAKDKFTAKVTTFDTFNDGRKVVLNLEIDVQPQSESKKTLVVLLISPQAMEAPMWKQLRDIRQSVQKP